MARTMVETSCAFCGATLLRRPSHLHARSLCNNTCRSKLQSQKVQRPCGVCGELVSRSPSEAATSKSGELFCDRRCATIYNNRLKSGERHGNWKGGSASYRSRALRHYGSSCMNRKCEPRLVGLSVPEEMLDVHHVDEDRSNNEIENLIVLCVWCHARATRRLD